MSLAFKQIRVYVRGFIVLLVAGAVVLVLINNRGHEARVWFFGLTDQNQPVNVLWLMLCTAGGTLVAWWTVRVAWRLVRDMREVTRLRAVHDAEQRMRNREAAVEKREREVRTVETSPGDRAPEWE